MSHSLSKRFLFGPNNVAYLDPSTLEYDFFVGIPDRQRQMIAIGRRQEAACRAIQDTQRSASAHIINEIGQAGHALATSIEALLYQQERDASSISHAIESLQSKLLVELTESRWVLLQIENQQTEMLEILRKPRATQAEELMRQALANLSNGYYQEAADRLRKALEFDNTDYQAHRNLGFVYVHNDKPAEAAEHFRKAISFSPIPTMKLAAICDLARVHYAAGMYDEAASTMRGGLGMVSSVSLTRSEHARLSYTHAAYACLAGRSDECLASLKNALELDPSSLSRALIDADFSPMRADVDRFLEHELNGAMLAANETGVEVQVQLARLVSEGGADGDVGKRTRELVDKSLERIRRGGYADVVLGRDCLRRLSIALDRLSERRSVQKRESHTRHTMMRDRKVLRAFDETEADEKARLHGVEESRARRRVVGASGLRIVLSLASFVVSAALGIVIVGQSYIECSRYNNASSAILGPFLWAILNVLLVPVALVLPFIICRKVWRSGAAAVAGAGREADIHYERADEHSEVASKVNEEKWSVVDLHGKAADLRHRVTQILDEVSERLAR